MNAIEHLFQKTGENSAAIQALTDTVIKIERTFSDNHEKVGCAIEDIKDSIRSLAQLGPVIRETNNCVNNLKVRFEPVERDAYILGDIKRLKEKGVRLTLITLFLVMVGLLSSEGSRLVQVVFEKLRAAITLTRG